MDIKKFNLNHTYKLFTLNNLKKKKKTRMRYRILKLQFGLFI